MQKNTGTFKLSNEELKKINHFMPKGYKLVVREEIIKKDLPPKPKKKPMAPLQTAVVANPVVSKTRSQKVKQEEYEPTVNIKVPTVLPAPVIPPNQPPAGTSPKLFERIKKHPVFYNLMKTSKLKESDTSLREIEIKVYSDPDSYRISDLQGDIQNFCLMLYKNYAKTSTQYKEAADLQNYLANLMKIEKNYESKKTQNTLPFQRASSTQQLGNIRKKMQPINRNVYQPIAESKLPTPAEKRLLGQMIKKLPSDSLQQVCYIVFESTQNRDYIFDLDTLHVKKFRELQEYVKKFMEKIGEWDQRNYDDEQFSNESFFVIEDDE